MAIKFNASTVKTGREIAGDIKSQLEAGTKHIPTMELAQAKSILGDLQRMKGNTSGQKGSITRAVNTLTDAIKQGELKNLATNLTDIRTPGGGGENTPVRPNPPPGGGSENTGRTPGRR